MNSGAADSPPPMPTGGGGGMQHQPTAERMHPYVRPGAPPGHDCHLRKVIKKYECCCEQSAHGRWEGFGSESVSVWCSEAPALFLFVINYYFLFKYHGDITMFKLHPAPILALSVCVVTSLKRA